MKIMKKILIATLAFFGIFAVSCNKEVEAPVAPEENTVAVHKQTIIATIGSETRTAYADFQKFSWKADDKVDILTYNESTEYFRIATFTAQEDGKTTVFEGDVEDGYNLVNLAVYPDRAGYIPSASTMVMTAPMWNKSSPLKTMPPCSTSATKLTNTTARPSMPRAMKPR